LKIPVFLLTLLGTAGLAVQAWTLNTLVELKSDVAALKAVVSHNNAVAKD
jgi:hypothetical protein